MDDTERRAMIVGGGGRLARALRPVLEQRGWRVLAPDRATLDITDAAAVQGAVRVAAPDVIVNVAAWTDLERCQLDPVGAELVNATAVGHLREAAQDVGAHLCQVSTDYVFDGAKAEPYVETDATAPLSAYGRSKRHGELEAGPDATVVRVAWVSSRIGRSLVRTTLEAALDPGAPLRFVTDQLGSPSVAEDLVPVIARLLEERPGGTFHVVNRGQASPWDLARQVLRSAGLDAGRVEPVSALDLVAVRSAPRPVQSALDCTKVETLLGVELRSWREAVDDLVRDLLRQAPAPQAAS